GLDPLQERYDPRLDRFMRNALDDLTRPAAPAAIAAAPRATGVRVGVPSPKQVQINGIVAFRHAGGGAVTPSSPGAARIALPGCTVFADRPGRGTFRYLVEYTNRWRQSAPRLGRAVRSSGPAARTAKTWSCLRRFP